MRTRKEKGYYILYCLFAKNLPISYRFKLGKILRGFFARKILKYYGKNIRYNCRFHLFID